MLDEGLLHLRQEAVGKAGPGVAKVRKDLCPARAPEERLGKDLETERLAQAQGRGASQAEMARTAAAPWRADIQTR